MNTQKEGTTPHFSEKPTTSKNSRHSILAAQRYAGAEERKGHHEPFDDAMDSDYERVELFSERRTGRSS